MIRSLHAMAFAFVCAFAACLPARAGTDPVVFESTADAQGNFGGVALLDGRASGYSFRLLQRTRISELSVRATATGEPRTIYGAIYRLGTQWSIPDIVTDEGLVGTTLLQVPVGTVGDVTGPIDVELEPGWYAVLAGIDRHGASAPAWSVTLRDTGMPVTPRTVGPYSLDSSGGRSLQALTLRFVLRGQVVPEPPRPSTEVLVRSAGPAALWTQSAYQAGQAFFYGTPFTVDRPVHARRAEAWILRGQGSVFAAVVRLPAAGALPPQPGTAAFSQALVAQAVFETGPNADSYGVDLPDTVLAPGAYALMLGSGLFGATGHASVMSVQDEIITADTLLWIDSAGYWTHLGTTFNLAFHGYAPDLTVAPEAVSFGEVPLGLLVERSVTVRNWRDGALHVDALRIEDDALAQFELGADAGACIGIDLPARGECTFSVRYRPVELGQAQARVAVDSDGDPSPAFVVLGGEGVVARTITPSVQGAGSIAPTEPQIVADGGQATFTLAPALGHHLDHVGGSCGGTLAGSSYTTAPASTDCTVDAVFALDPPTALAATGGTPQATAVGTPFGEPLRVRVTNAAGLPVPGVAVAFTAPASGASAALGGGAVTDADGIASIEASANTVAGEYDVLASVAGVGQATFALRNLAGPAAQVAVTGGSAQSTVVGTAFALPLQVRVSDAHGNAVGGSTVTFTPPASGAGATLAATTVQTGPDGSAATTATANTVAGDYTVQASVSGAGIATFALRNDAGAAAQVAVAGGSAQSTVVGTAFALPLQVRVSDAHGNAVGGSTVTFTPPASGAGATLVATTVQTGPDGSAATTATANAIVGTYAVQASVAGIGATASFALENLPPDVVLSAAIDDGREYAAYGDVLEYTIVVHNGGSKQAAGIDVTTVLPPALDAAAASWTCLDAATGACSEGGTGPLVDHGVRVPPSGSVAYTLTLPVRADAAEGEVEVALVSAGAYPGESTTATDRTQLVLLRDGFDPPPEADGPRRGAPPPSR